MNLVYKMIQMNACQSYMKRNTPILTMAAFFRLINLNQYFVMTGHKTNNDGVCIDWS